MAFAMPAAKQAFLFDPKDKADSFFGEPIFVIHKEVNFGPAAGLEKETT